MNSSDDVLDSWKLFSDLLSTQLGEFLARTSPAIRLAEARAVTYLEMKGRILTWEIHFDEVNLLLDHVEFVARNTRVRVNVDIVKKVFRSSVIAIGDVSQETTTKLREKGKDIDTELTAISQILKNQIDTAMLR